MDVMLVTMVFPWPSEAFVGVEVRALAAGGCRLRVRALRSSHPRSRDLLRDWRLDGLDLTSWSPGSVLRGVAFALRHPWMTLRTVGWLVWHGAARPVLLGRCLLLLPRMLAVFAECRASPPAVLCLYWGHYPAVLAYLVKRWVPGVHVAMSLNAYDLVYAFPPSVVMARQVDTLWTITPANLPAFAALGLDPDRVHVSLHGIELAQVPVDCSQKVPGEFVTVARLEENKGVDDVIRAFAAVAANHGEARLTVVGEGPDRPRLESLAREAGVAGRVHFTGGIGHSEVYGLLARASVLLLLSRSPAERLPNAVKEAMACRCLCIVTRTPGIEFLLGHLAASMVVEQGDWQAAAGWLQATLHDPARFEPDRDAAATFARENLDAAGSARQRCAIWSGSQ